MTYVSNNPGAARFAFDNTYARELEGPLHALGGGPSGAA